MSYKKLTDGICDFAVNWSVSFNGVQQGHTMVDFDGSCFSATSSNLQVVILATYRDNNEADPQASKDSPLSGFYVDGACGLNKWGLKVNCYVDSNNARGLKDLVALQAKCDKISPSATPTPTGGERGLDVIEGTTVNLDYPIIAPSSKGYLFGVAYEQDYYIMPAKSAELSRVWICGAKRTAGSNTNIGIVRVLGIADPQLKKYNPRVSVCPWAEIESYLKSAFSTDVASALLEAIKRQADKRPYRYPLVSAETDTRWALWYKQVMDDVRAWCLSNKNLDKLFTLWANKKYGRVESNSHSEGYLGYDTVNGVASNLASANRANVDTASDDGRTLREQVRDNDVTNPVVAAAADFCDLLLLDADDCGGCGQW